MTPEIENEQLRTRLAEMAAEIERLQSVIDEANAQEPLAKSYKNSSTGTGIDFLVINEMPEGETELYARPIPAHVIQKGFVLWPENLTFDMVAAYESAILCPISALSGEGYLRMLNVVKSQFNNPLRSASSPRITEQDALAIAESLEPFFDNITQSFDLPAWHGRVLWTLLDKLNGDKNAQ